MKLKADTVAFIVANDILKQHVEAILKGSIASGDVIVVKMDVSNLEMEGRALVDSGVGAIVARGGTYEDLKKVITSIPVIRIEVAASDILFSLARAKDKYREIYLILHKSIVFDFETWKDRRSYDGSDFDLSVRKRAYWTNFIKTGDPNGEGLPRWENYGENNRKVMELGEHVGMIPAPLNEHRRFIVDYMLRQAN